MNLLAIVTEVRRWAVLALLVALAAAIALAGFSWRRAGDAESALRAANKRAELRAKGDVPVEPVPDARPALEAAMQRNEVFAAQVEKLEKDLAHAKAQLVLHAETAPSKIEAPPRPEPPAGAPHPPCYLAEGDQITLKLELAVLRGDDDVEAAAGTMEAWAMRVGEAEPVLLARRPFSGPLTTVQERARPPLPVAPRWAVGVRAWLDPRKLATTPATYGIDGGLRLFWRAWATAEVRLDGQAAAGLRLEF